MRKLFVLALLACLVPRVAWAACAIVGTPVTATFNTGGNTTVSYSPTAGDTVVVGLMVDNNSVTTVTDNLSGTYTSDNNAHVDVNGSGVYQVRRFNVPSGITTITIQNTGNPGCYVVTEFSGGTNTLDLHPTGGSATATAAWATPLSGTLSQAAEIVFGLVGAQTTASITLSSGPSNGYTLLGFLNDTNGSGQQIGMGYLVTSATTSTSTTFTVSSSARTYNGTTTTYECTAAAPPPAAGFLPPGMP